MREGGAAFSDPGDARRGLSPGRVGRYSRAAMQRSLARVTLVSLHQPVSIFHGITATAYSAGASLGGVLWHLRTPVGTLWHLSAASLSRARHPLPLEIGALATPENSAGPTVCLVSDLCRQPLGAAGLGQSFQDISNAIATTVAAGGNVLLPLQPRGFLFDLVDLVLHALAAAKQHTVPVYLVGPSMKAALAFANIFNAW